MTASSDTLWAREPERKRAERWSGIVLALLMLSAFALAGRQIWVVATGPLPPGPGQAAPLFSGSDLEGRSIALADLRGKVVLLDFWATWCPPCVASMPHLQSVHDEFGARGVLVIGVNEEPGEEELVKSFVAMKRLTFPSLIDPGGIHTDYGVYSFPTSFLIDRGGIVRAVFRGPPSREQLRRALEPLL